MSRVPTVYERRDGALDVAGRSSEPEQLGGVPPGVIDLLFGQPVGAQLGKDRGAERRHVGADGGEAGDDVRGSLSGGGVVFGYHGRKRSGSPAVSGTPAGALTM